jgi:predicted phosphodiesterase
MRIAALYDMHGNLPAVEAVLEDVRASRVDRILIGGDVVPGPMPLECLDAIRNCGIPWDAIAGNGEIDAVIALDRGDLSHVPATFRNAIEWSASQLSAADKAMIRTWPMTRTLATRSLGDILFCHATPRSAREIFTERTPDERVSRALESATAGVIVCGHTHMQFDRTVGSRRVVNSGSIGLPFGDPGAYWLLLGEGVELRRTAYDIDVAAARIRSTDYPMAAVVADQLTSPPAAALMLERYEQAAI